MSGRPALFLDRDGVINIDHAYVYRPQDFEFVDGIFQLCRAAQGMGYLLIIITNQAGIGRGYYTEEDFNRLTEWMCGEFKREGVTIDGVYFCPYHPEHGVGKFKIDSPFRKPAPGMLFQAAKEHNIDFGKSVLIGDKDSDIQAGKAAGVGLNLFYGQHDPAISSGTPIASLLDAVAKLSSMASI